jgi:hypothetical protein
MTEDKVMNESQTSSLPFADLKAKTKGLQPRSREANDRTLFLKPTQDNIDYYRGIFSQSSVTKTYIDPKLIPDEVVTLWARREFKGVPDSTNLLELERQGWKFATPALFPSLAFMDKTGHIDDSAGRIRNSEFDLMYREKFIHELQLDKYRRATENKNNVKNHIGSDSNFGKDSHPFGGISHSGDRLSSGYNNLYADTSLSREVIQDHLR